MEKLTKEQFDSQIAELRLRKETLELQNLEEQIEERQMARENKQSVFKTRGQALKDSQRARESASRQCNHRKGGPGHLFTSGGGDDNKYSIIKHTMPNRDIMVMCTRCLTTWVPPIYPIRADYSDKAAFEAAVAEATAKLAEYKTALAWPTDNQPSSGATFMMPESNSQACRQSLHDSTVTG